jgi:hypothetical protein
VPSALTERLGMTIGGQVLSVSAEVGLVLLFGAVMLLISIRTLRRPA